MASRIKAIMAYCPRLQRIQAATINRFLELVTQRTTFSNGLIKNVQETEIETIIGLLREGRAAHTGAAIYTPTVDLHGKITIKVRANSRLQHAINVPGAYTGSMLNSENVGLSSAELIAMWNTDHPTDPVV
jgi:hypothetical protein